MWSTVSYPTALYLLLCELMSSSVEASPTGPSCAADRLRGLSSYQRRLQSETETHVSCTHATMDKTMLLYPWQILELTTDVDLPDDWTREDALSILSSSPELMSTLNDGERALLSQSVDNEDTIGGVVYRRSAGDGTAVPATRKGKAKQQPAGSTSDRRQAFVQHQALGIALVYLARGREVPRIYYNPVVEPAVLPLVWTEGKNAMIVLDMAKKASCGAHKAKDCIRLQVCGAAHQCTGRSFSAGKKFCNHKAVEGIDSEGGQVPRRTKGNSHLVAGYRSFLSLPVRLILRVHAATWNFAVGGKDEAYEKGFAVTGVRPELWRTAVGGSFRQSRLTEYQ